MDAAQMLTAQEIARQCEQLARAEATREDASVSGRRRHLRLVDPITEPIPVVEDDSADAENPDAENPGVENPGVENPGVENRLVKETASGQAVSDEAMLSRGEASRHESGRTSAMAGSSSAPARERLGDREWEILAFERQWWKHPGAKEKAIRELFDMSASRYYQLLNAVVDKPAALEADPMLVKRLRKVRVSRQRARRARRLGIEWH